MFALVVATDAVVATRWLRRGARPAQREIDGANSKRPHRGPRHVSGNDVAVARQRPAGGGRRGEPGGHRPQRPGSVPERSAVGPGLPGRRHLVDAGLSTRARPAQCALGRIAERQNLRLPRIGLFSSGDRLLFQALPTVVSTPALASSLARQPLDVRPWPGSSWPGGHRSATISCRRHNLRQLRSSPPEPSCRAGSPTTGGSSSPTARVSLWVHGCVCGVVLTVGDQNGPDLGRRAGRP